MRERAVLNDERVVNALKIKSTGLDEVIVAVLQNIVGSGSISVFLEQIIELRERTALNREETHLSKAMTRVVMAKVPRHKRALDIENIPCGRENQFLFHEVTDHSSTAREVVEGGVSNQHHSSLAWDLDETRVSVEEMSEFAVLNRE